MKTIWKCEYCGAYAKKNDRIAKRYCSKECAENAKRKICEICGREYQAYLDSQRFCHRCGISTEANRIRYNEHVSKKACAECGALFVGTSKATLCQNCYIENWECAMIHEYNIIVRPILCKKCDTIMSHEKVKDTSRTLPHRHGQALCDICKNKHIRERAKTGELRKKKSYYKKVSEPKKRRTRKQASRRMRIDNPMFNPQVRRRVSKTLRKKYKTGELNVPTGPKNHLWKGNRSFNLTVRTRLYSIWIRPILERDGFLCTICGRGGQLQVHHTRPLREIIESVGARLSIKEFDTYKSDPRYDNFIQMVIDEHKLCDGITVCKSCHTKIDRRYRVKCE